MTQYTCGFFPRILAIIPATRYTCVFCHVYLRFIPKYMTIFLQTRIYMRTKKPIYICVTNKHVVYGVTESRRIRGTELYPQEKSHSCTMELKSNFSLNQAWRKGRVNFGQDVTRTSEFAVYLSEGLNGVNR